MRDLDRKDVIVKVGADAIEWLAQRGDVAEIRPLCPQWNIEYMASEFEVPARDVVDADAEEVE